MARLLSCIALFVCISFALAYQPENAGYGFDQSLSYSGSSPDPGTGSVPTVPSVGGGVGGVPSVPSVGGGVGSDGYGSNPSSGSGSIPGGSVPGGDGSYGGVPSVDPSGGTGSIPTVPSVGGGIPTVPSSGGIPTVPSVGGGIPTVPSIGGGIPTVPSIGGGIPTAPVSGGTGSAGPCSCSFWAAHVNSWPDPLQLISTVAALFGGAASNAFPNVTLLQALKQQKTDPYSQLLRQGTTAMLNAYGRPRFQYTPQAVRTQFNAALSSAHAAGVQAAKFEHANNGYGTNTFCS